MQYSRPKEGMGMGGDLPEGDHGVVLHLKSRDSRGCRLMNGEAGGATGGSAEGGVMSSIHKIDSVRHCLRASTWAEWLPFGNKTYQTESKRGHLDSRTHRKPAKTSSGHQISVEVTNSSVCDFFNLQKEGTG